MKKVTAIVDREKCQPTKCNQECISYDPLNRSGEEGFKLGEHGKAEIGEELVTEMHRICAKMCPLHAIKIVKLPEALDQDPIHSFGQNQFRLFNLPTPLFGKVIGILGVNGIGKSTALNILAGLLKPNLGKVGQDAKAKELIEYFKGSEAQVFFEKLAKGEIKISYKPQQVHLIAKTKKGTVKELLSKVDEKKELDKISKLLELEKIMDHEIANISGGELQRVAIAATVLKKANVYVFDEPTSYLDIKQRLKVAKFIKELATEDTAVLVVEHDLIILDYMTDLVHIMYGQEAAYGIVANPRPTKSALNTFLSGLLKEENIRFRDYEIKFSVRPPLKNQEGMPVVTWKDVKKKLGSFCIEAKEGNISTKDVIGILGENGIGKTTFVRILAKDIDSDSGEVDEKVTVSYKPQYLDTESDDIVMNVLNEAIQKHKSQLIVPLHLDGLLNRKLSELSGGELQRVMIALCLGRDADLFLLDEPSAYLDVEQRLIVSKIIHDFMDTTGKSCIVVDHDLLFLDYLSKKLIVFDGIPAESGNVTGPFSMEEGMNHFLEDLGITFRRDEETRRPRSNKVDSLKDREQKKSGKYYYS